MTGGEILVRCLIEQGVDTIFGMPGGHLEGIYAALYDHQKEIRHILVRNEQAASLMADGYARASGRPGVCVVIPGPGASNAATGLGEAASASVPVLLITSKNEARIAGKAQSRLFHGLDHMAFFAPVARLCKSARAVQDIPGMVQEAFAILRSGRPGPVALEAAKDVLETEGDATIPPEVQPKRIEPGDNEIAKAAEMLAVAERPVIIAGSGVLHTNACDGLGRLARMLRCPVVTTQNARGAISDDDPLSLGDITVHCSRTALQESDLALALGCRFVHFDTIGWNLKLPRLIHIEADPSYIGVDFETALGIAADVAPAIEMLLGKLTAGEIRSDWGDRIKALRAEREVEKEYPIVTVLRRALPDDAILIGDVNMTAYRLRRAYKVTAPRRYFASNSYCTLGYGLPAALGAKAACPDRPVVSVIGDGGFLMTCQELATAAQFGIHIVAVVVNDNCLTSIKMGQDKRWGKRFIGVDLQNPDFPALARAFGLRGCRAADDAALEAHLREALASDTTTVIERPIEKRY
ncbi:MAG: thiamine pyrophosphate-binding protein [Planctomycetota bacterium]